MKLNSFIIGAAFLAIVVSTSIVIRSDLFAAPSWTGNTFQDTYSDTAGFAATTCTATGDLSTAAGTICTGTSNTVSIASLYKFSSVRIRYTVANTPVTIRIRIFDINDLVTPIIDQMLSTTTGSHDVTGNFPVSAESVTDLIYIFDIDASGIAGTPPVINDLYFNRSTKNALPADTFYSSPNPFNPLNAERTVFRYTLSENSDVRLTIYDVTGKIVGYGKNLSTNSYADSNNPIVYGSVASGGETFSDIYWDGEIVNSTSYVRSGTYIAYLEKTSNTGVKVSTFRVTVLKR